jgi:hypothetical protein
VLIYAYKIALVGANRLRVLIVCLIVGALCLFVCLFVFADACKYNQCSNRFA